MCKHATSAFHVLERRCRVLPQQSASRTTAPVIALPSRAVPVHRLRAASPLAATGHPATTRNHPFPGGHSTCTPKNARRRYCSLATSTFVSRTEARASKLSRALLCAEPTEVCSTFAELDPAAPRMSRNPSGTREVDLYSHRATEVTLRLQCPLHHTARPKPTQCSQSRPHQPDRPKPIRCRQSPDPDSSRVPKCATRSPDRCQ